MHKETTTTDKPFPTKSKKEHVTGVRPLDKEGQPKASPLLGGIRLEEAVTIGRPLRELYAYWRNFTNLPKFCKDLQEVVFIDEMRSRWTVNGPGDKPLMWEATIIEDIPDQLISWRSLADSDLVNAGSVRFKQAPGDRGTEIVLTFSYNPPAGPLGSLIAKLTAKEPAVLLREQLRRFKQLMETGEIPTTDGQSAVIES